MNFIQNRKSSRSISIHTTKNITRAVGETMANNDQPAPGQDPGNNPGPFNPDGQQPPAWGQPAPFNESAGYDAPTAPFESISGPPAGNDLPQAPWQAPKASNDQGGFGQGGEMGATSGQPEWNSPSQGPGAPQDAFGAQTPQYGDQTAQFGAASAAPFGQGGQQSPFGGQGGYGGPGGPDDPGQQYGGPGGGSGGNRKRMAIILSIIGALVIAAIVLVIVLVNNNNNSKQTDPTSSSQASQSDPTSSSGSGPTESSAGPTESSSAGQPVQQGTADAAVVGLVSALRDGQAVNALKFIDTTKFSNVGDEANLLLTDAVYAAATKRPTDIRIEETKDSYSDDRKEVVATIVTGAEERRVNFKVTKTGPDNAENPWQIDMYSLPSIYVTGAAGATIKVNGVDVQMPAGESEYTSTRLPVLPGSYAFERVGNRWESYGAATAVDVNASALDSSSAVSSLKRVQFKKVRTAAYKTDTQAAVKAYLAQCAKSTDAAPKGCPFRVNPTYQGKKATGLKWTVTKQPTITTSTSGSSDRVYTSGGKVRVTGKAGSARVYRDVSLYFSGESKIVDGKLVFTPSN